MNVVIFKRVNARTELTIDAYAATSEGVITLLKDLKDVVES